MIRILFSITFILTISNCQESGKLTPIASLPNSMDEISGIEMIPNSDLIWMINDSGNSNLVYGYNIKSKSIEKTLRIGNGDNIDWEDLATDIKGNLYIGDFGNNNNKRKNLTIYGLKDPLSFINDEIEASITSFTFEDQKKFPPKSKKLNFDVEAFIHLNDHFYLFTKNRSSKFDGVFKVYRIPAKEGHFVAKLIDQYSFCNQKKECQITSSTIHHASGIIALLSSNKVWLLRNYQEDRFFSGGIMTLELEDFSQKESITFKNQNELYIADERHGIEGGNIYLLKLPSN
jgi:hypothetical protein